MSSDIQILRGQPDEAELAMISAAVVALNLQHSQNAQHSAQAAEQHAAGSALSRWQRAARLESVRSEPDAAPQQAHSLWPG